MPTKRIENVAEVHCVPIKGDVTWKCHVKPEVLDDAEFFIVNDVKIRSEVPHQTVIFGTYKPHEIYIDMEDVFHTQCNYDENEIHRLLTCEKV